MNKILGFILLFLVCLLPALLFSREEIIDAYNCITLASVEKSLIVGRIASVSFGNFYFDPYHQGHLGHQAIIIIISEICGLSAKKTAILPIGGIIVPFTFFALAKKIFNSNALACFFAIFMAYDPSLSPGHYSIFAYAWVRPLFFVFIILTIRILEGGKRWEDTLLLFLIFVGTFFLYWTTPAIMILFLFGVNLLLLIQTLRGKQSKIKRKLTTNSVLVFTVIYLAFSKILYNEFLPAVIHEKYGTTTDALAQFLTWISFRQSTMTEKYTVVTSGNPVYDWILIFRYIIILIPIMVYIFVKLIEVCREQKLQLSLDTYSYLMWSIIFAGLAQSIAYAARGHLSFRYISILFLPVTLISLDRLKAERVKKITLLILMILVFSGFSYLLLGGLFNLNKTSNIEISAQFLFNKSNYDAKALTDLNTFGIYLLEGVFQQKSLSIKLYNSDIYEMVVGTSCFIEKNNLGEIVDYVIINKVMANSPTAAGGWKKYEPLSNYFSEINSNTNINKIYDDSKIWIFKT